MRTAYVIRTPTVDRIGGAGRQYHMATIFPKGGKSVFPLQKKAPLAVDLFPGSMKSDALRAWHVPRLALRFWSTSVVVIQVRSRGILVE